MPDESSRTVLLAGATGLVGGLCLRRLLADATVGRVIAPTRRPLSENLRALDSTGKLEAHLVDFAHLANHAALFAVDQIICALGSTIKKAGSRERFREFDYGYPLQIARLGLQQGAQHFLLVSALGADARSRIFYNRVKGELEEAMVMLPYRSITIARPSLLLGPRQELRPAEASGWAFCCRSATSRSTLRRWRQCWSRRRGRTDLEPASSSRPTSRPKRSICFTPEHRTAAQPFMGQKRPKQ